MPLPTASGLLASVYRHPLYMQNLIVRRGTSLARHRWAETDRGADENVPAPLGYKLVLTYKCNLRCVMCYEWGDVGWCHEQPKQITARELDWYRREALFSGSPYATLLHSARW